MNRKQIALLTGILLLSNISISNTNQAENIVSTAVRASKTKRKKTSDKYPDISNKLDLTSMEQYESVDLFMNVTLKNFYIRDLALTNTDEYTLLLAPIKSSDQYFLVTGQTNYHLKKGQKISVEGFLNGKTSITADQVKLGLNQKYLNREVVSMMADKILLSKINN
ncbi:hypothetical protein [Companilactobacillus sp. FL22-1]|uniref:hypothetical protein n=1 Tax=Companilactobacillus sp. FL22-1 TaxID=3373892 RepID=UPI003754E674